MDQSKDMWPFERTSTMVSKQLLITFVMLLTIETVSTADACQKLAVCALDKCVPASTSFPNESEIIPFLLRKANFGCILGPTCYESCSECDSCIYAQEQMKNLVLHEPLSGTCPKLEACAQSCIDDGVKDPFSCVFRERCIHHCLDNRDCTACYDIVKRVFTGYCYRSGFIEHYGKRCKVFFDDLAAELVAKVTAKN